MVAGAGAWLQWRIQAFCPAASIVKLEDDFGAPNQAEFVPGRSLDRGRIILDPGDLGAKLPDLLG